MTLHSTLNDKAKYKDTRMCKRCVPFILAPLGGGGGVGLGPIPNTSKHLVYLAILGGVCFSNFSDQLYVALDMDQNTQAPFTFLAVVRAYENWYGYTLDPPEKLLFSSSPSDYALFKSYF